MIVRRLGLCLLAYLLGLSLLCLFVRWRMRLQPSDGHEVIASVWREGRLVSRAVLAREDPSDPRVGALLAGDQLVFETVVGEGEVLAAPALVLALSFVPGRDGARVTLAGRGEALLTTDDLLAAQIFDRGFAIADIGLSVGLDTNKLAVLAGERLHATAQDVLARASWRRIRCRRRTSDAVPSVSSPGATGGSNAASGSPELRAADVTVAVLAAAHHLARGVSEQGRYRYAVDAVTNDDRAGYDWARHAGTTAFLARAWRLSPEPELREAVLRAAASMAGAAMGSCAGRPCIGEGDLVPLGGSALGLLAYDEIVSSGLEPSYRAQVAGLADFLRSQQRSDGEFMHRFDRRAMRPLDVQGLYYSGEAALALARAYPITQNRDDLSAASSAVAYLVGPAWRFFGDRYYFGEEHWTCQAAAAVDELRADRSSPPPGLALCLGWQGLNRALQLREDDASFDADGALGLGPWIMPRTTPVASRCEAAVATLAAARRAGVAAEELHALESQVGHALAFLLRRQFRPGPTHLLRDPAAVYGAMPASEVDWELRIDYAQHAGSAMLGWLELQR